MKGVVSITFLLLSCLSIHFNLIEGGVVKGIQYVNVGSDGGVYSGVTQMIPNNGQWNVCPGSSSADPAVCYRTSVNKRGSLVPFDEDLTLALRGPMTVKNIAVYVPTSNNWYRKSYWDSSNTNNLNLVWMNNAGEWSICHGNGQSFMGSSGKGAAGSPQSFSGVLANDMNVNVMSNVDCTPSLCPGFNRGTAKVGWKGNVCGEKMFVITAQMPHDTSGWNNNDMPAIWLLNGQVVRTNQWGCNCRGMGGNGGCGELDIAEVLSTNSDQCTSTFYSFKQSLGASPNYFARPTTSATTYLVVFDAGGTGTISIFEKPNFSYETTISRSTVSTWIHTTNPQVSVYLSPSYTGPACAVPSGVVEEVEAQQQQQALTIVAAVCGVVVFVILVVVVAVVVVVKRRKIETV